MSRRTAKPPTTHTEQRAVGVIRMPIPVHALVRVLEAWNGTTRGLVATIVEDSLALHVEVEVPDDAPAGKE